MRSRLSGVLAVALLVGACGSAGPTAAPTEVATPTPAPTPTTAPAATSAATASAGNPFAGQPFSMTLPEGWQAFDLHNPAGKAAIDQFVAANPQMGAAIQAFEAVPNVVFSVNALLGNVLIAFSLPTGGVPLDTLKQTFNGQFQAVPGLEGTPVAEDVTLPAGQAVHWDLKISVNGAAGQKATVEESLYLVEHGSSAVLVEFVATGGVPIPQEDAIIRSLAFTP